MLLVKDGLAPVVAQFPMEMSVCCKVGMTWVTAAGAGRSVSACRGNLPVWVDVMMVPFGILTRTPGVALSRLLVMSVGFAKCPVAPVSRTKVRCGEGDRLNADDKGFSLLLLFLPPSRDRHMFLGLPHWLPPLLSCRVASS